jgi:hypothetical protein
MNMNIHKITSITKEKTITDSLEDGRKYHHTALVIKTAYGETLTIDMFADKKENLEIQKRR